MGAMNKAGNTRQRDSLARSWSVIFTAISLLFVLSACGGTGSASATPGTSGTSAASTCNKSTGLTVYSAQGYDSDVTKAFQQQTGITTKLVDDSTGNLLAKSLRKAKIRTGMWSGLLAL
ncbi:MAG TPA: hypothetical protein VGD98_08535 [Ktedonobacteraceae bacterium]